MYCDGRFYRSLNPKSDYPKVGPGEDGVITDFGAEQSREIPEVESSVNKAQTGGERVRDKPRLLQ